VVPGPRSATNRAQWDQIFALADSAQVDRLVIDIRNNGGGNGGLNRYPVQQILRRPALDRPGHLFVITGRRTFSAAQQFANLLEAWTQATFVGEPTGQKPSQYGDHRPLELPNSHVLIQLSTVFHQAPNEFDQRSFVPPTWYTPLTSVDYAVGKDPAMDAILAGNPLPPTIDQVEAAIERGDSAAAEQALRAGQAGTINRFRSLESEVNGLGYRLLGSGETAKAVQVFQLNTRVYPRSANTFDSLGEALLAAGRRDDAIAAYRHAVEVEPGFPPSVQALQRLGVR
jgi:tetratricopeptide (TPR) repeat protein